MNQLWIRVPTALNLGLIHLLKLLTEFRQIHLLVTYKRHHKGCGRRGCAGQGVKEGVRLPCHPWVLPSRKPRNPLNPVLLSSLVSSWVMETFLQGMTEEQTTVSKCDWTKRVWSSAKRLSTETHKAIIGILFFGLSVQYSLLPGMEQDPFWIGVFQSTTRQGRSDNFSVAIAWSRDKKFQFLWSDLGRYSWARKHRKEWKYLPYTYINRLSSKTQYAKGGKNKQLYREAEQNNLQPSDQV
jgi:hypothetical protein